VTKIYYLELRRASEGTLSRWSRLYLQSLAPTPVSRRVDVKQAAGQKIIAESLSQHDDKHIVPTLLMDMGREKKNKKFQTKTIWVDTVTVPFVVDMCAVAFSHGSFSLNFM
jgi:hypothetical protein